ncbi:MAG: ATP-binding cassette domain-containing protein [Myxococcales bacterium]|nr:ATP-binding cassette domain-containing protein [Myxococcales bacterium]
MDALRLRQISKRYGAVHAVRDVDVAFETGRVHAVVGENGAGKSTLLRIAAGLVRADSGRIFVEDQEQLGFTAAGALARGVGMVEQHFALVPVFTVLENMVLGREPGGFFGLRLERVREAARRAFEQIGASVPLDARVEALGVGDRQRVEIARLLFRGARTLILDEPTAVLTAREAERLYGKLRILAGSGCSIVVVTHKLDEVLAFADTVTIMRRGAIVETRPVHRGSGQEESRALARAIMGTEPLVPPPRPTRRAGAPVLSVERVSLGTALRDVSFQVSEGEVVGVAGVEGNGQEELVRIIAGLAVPDAGRVTHAGTVSVVHGDRHREGLVLGASVADNLVLGELAAFSRLGPVRVGFLRPGLLANAAAARRDAVGVVPTDLSLPVSALSGGNQQKVVVARALARTESGLGLLVLAHPTRGVDLGAARAIHDLVRRLVEHRPIGALVLSSDLDELRTLSHRLLVLSRGTIATELSPDASDLAIGEQMLGLGAEVRA